MVMQSNAKSHIGLIFLMAVIASLVLVGASGDKEGPPADPGDGAYISIDGTNHPAREGRRFTPQETGATQDEHGCILPNIEVGNGLSGDYHSGSIELDIGADCSITVSEIGSERTPYPQGSLSTGTRNYMGWAQSVLHDFVHLPLTRVTTRMTYTDTGTRVYNGRSARTDCRVLYHGWRKLSCSTLKSTSGPREIWVRGAGAFVHRLIDPSRHSMVAIYRGRPGGHWFYSCTKYGRVTGPVHWHCSGGRANG